MAEELKREFRTNPDRIEIIPNWLDTRVFFPITKTNAPGAASLSLVYVGWLNADKGVEYLLQATKLLSMKRSDFHLTLYGGGDLEASLKLQSNELEIAKLVTFHGWIDNKEVPDALNRGDIFVFPSLKEGMPNSLLQAMACGLPVIATRISSIPGLIAEGRNGLLVDPKSSGQLAIAIESLLDSPKLREQMGAKNAEQIRQFHCLEKAWEKVGKILLPELKIAPDRLDNAN